MNELDAKAQQKILDLLNGVYHKLATHPQVSDEQRELLPSEEELMQNLDPECFYYQSLLRSLAIDSYSSAIVNQSSLSQQLCAMLTATLQLLNQMGELLKKNAQKKDVLEKFNRSCQCLVETIKISQEVFPKTSYIQDQNNLIQSLNISTKIDESAFSKLRHENQQLRKKSQANQIQFLNMESKLTKLLKQHQGCERSQGIGNKISNIELREQLALKQAQIQRMNEQFSFEIEKYNTVFEAMKRQLEEMKGYQNIDLIQQIELLQTEIVKLREQRDRDQIIIRQLRSDHTAFAMGGGGYYSPRQSSRYHSRYEY